MTKTILNIKTDKEVKDEARRIAAELGLPLSTVVNAYLKEFIREKAVHLFIAPSMSPRLERLLAGVEKDIKENKNLSSSFSSQREVRGYLDNLK